jgi:hypothetical protein
MLGFETLSEVKTEYMIQGTYADYVIQIGGKISTLKKDTLLATHQFGKTKRLYNCGLNYCILENKLHFNLSSTFTFIAITSISFATTAAT